MCVPGMQVLDSIGVDIGASLGSAPKTKIQTQAAPAPVQQESDDELLKRLAALK